MLLKSRGLTMSEGHQRPQRVEDDTRADQPIDVQFAKEPHGCDAALVDIVVVLFKASSNVLEDLVDNRYRERGVVSL